MVQSSSGREAWGEIHDSKVGVDSQDNAVDCSNRAGGGQA